MVRFRTLLLSLACALAVFACTGDGGADSTSTVPIDTTTSSQPGETTTTAARIVFEELPGTESLPESVQEELLELVNITQDLRELNFIEAPIISVVTSAELEALVREQIEEEAENLPADQALYELLGLLDSTVNLQALLTDLYGEQVAGFYDGETGEMVVPITASGFSQVQRATLVHELTHALTDQNFDFHPKYQAMFDEERYDEASAYQALIEGDASFTEVLYLQTLSQQELGEFFAEALQVDIEQFESAPQFIQDSLLFPYDTGLTFVQHIYMADGWETVNEAYQRFVDLPGSTEQVITPDDYGRDLPLEVTMPEIDVPGYELRESSVWGELGFRILFSEVLGDNATLEAADGWGGDRYSFWFDGSNAVFVLVYEGDTSTDRDEAEEALLEFARSSVPDPAFVWVEVINDQLTFIASDVPSVGEKIRDSLKG
ncbi:MAG: hypothetical protein ACFCU2_09315 [Acidimicrobiia bacterium]